MRGERLDKPTVAELLRAEAAKAAPPPTPAPERPEREVGDDRAGGMMPSPA